MIWTSVASSFLCGDADAQRQICNLAEQEEDERARFQARFILRLRKILIESQAAGYPEASPLDKLLLVRQFCRMTGESLSLPSAVLEASATLLSSCSLSLTRHGDEVTFDAQSWCNPIVPDYVPPATFDARPELRRVRSRIEPDAALLRWTKHSHYTSEAQKEAMAAIMTAPPASTLLVVLPTGGGKSLCNILPALHATRGGRKNGGCTVVIVPTVALSDDQELATRPYFDNAERYASLTGDTPQAKKAAVLTRLRTGDLALLYMSPEAALGSVREALLDATSSHNVHSLVIDEAHLIESWGRRFRPAFQQLSHLQREMLERNPALKTILLSATVTPNGQALLRKLFTRQGEFRIVSANAMRDECDVLALKASSDEEKDEVVAQLLLHAPRPLLLYTTQVEDANQWSKRLNQLGFRRHALYTGKTNQDQRRTIVEGWRNDAYDVVVGTAAFGLGIDKPDVRTVVHACLPESPNRWYQEIGRGGRDGYACTGVMVVSKADLHSASANTFSDFISSEKALTRWTAMFEAHRPVDNSTEKFLIKVDTTILPTHLAEAEKSDLNESHNHGVLLLLERAGLISRFGIDEDPTRTTVEITEAVLQPGPTVQALIEETRKIEIEHAKREFHTMSDLVLGRERTCFNSVFAALYGISDYYYCAHCQSCWRNEITDHLHACRPHLSHWVLPVVSPLHHRLTELLSGFGRLLVEDDGAGDTEAIEKRGFKMARRLAEAGVGQFIIDTSRVHSLAQYLRRPDSTFGLVIPPSRLVGPSYDTIERLPTCYLVMDGDHDSDRAVGTIDANPPPFPLIIVVPRRLTFRSLDDMKLRDKLTASSTALETLLRQLEDDDDEG